MNVLAFMETGYGEGPGEVAECLAQNLTQPVHQSQISLAFLAPERACLGSGCYRGLRNNVTLIPQLPEAGP